MKCHLTFSEMRQIMSPAAVRFNCQLYPCRNHIPGAVYLNTICGENTDMFPRNIPSKEKFESVAQEAGINAESHVIVYSSSDRCGYFISGRGWWSFKVMRQRLVELKGNEVEAGGAFR